MLRIIAGKARGRRIRAPSGRGTRPMRDFVREAVFDVIGERVAGARVLDLFAGSGSLGLEALSRGAEEAVFVERSRRAVETIRANLEALGMEKEGRVARADVLAFLHREEHPERPFDLIFIDPPYKINLEYREELLKRLVEGGFLASSALLVVQAPLRRQTPSIPKEIVLLRRRKYGEAAVDVYMHVKGAEGEAER